MNEPSMEWVDITAVEAEAWLGKNKKNRTLRQRAVNAMADDMRRGDWQVTGESIKFALGGDLLDGQHRLQALVQASDDDPDFAVRMLVLRGLTPESQSVMDTGIKRGVGDALSLDGVRNPQAVASAVRMLVKYETGTVVSNTLVVTTSRIRDWLAENTDFEDFVADIHWKTRQIPAYPAPQFASYWLMMQSNSDKFEEFLNGMATLANLGAGDPRLILYRRLTDIRANREATTAHEQMAILIVGWNHFLAGHQITKIQKPKGGAWTTSNFPKVK